MLWRWFPRSKAASKLGSEDYQCPLSGKELLGTPRRQAMVKMLWDTTSLTQSVFDEYLLAPIERYAELVQLLPASESHHHAYSGGMLDHALEMACYGLRLRQRHLLPPGAKPEDQSSAGEVWSAAVVYGALMHDVAKVLVDMDIHLEDGRTWRLWQGNIPQPYRIRYRKGRDYHLHSAINPMLCQLILGDQALDWLFSQPPLFGMFLYAIAGHVERAGVIGEIVMQADRASVARAMGGNPVAALQAPVESIQRKLADGLRYVIKQQIKLNEKGAQGYLTNEALWVVTPLVPRELKAHLLSHGIEGIPSSDTRLYDEMQGHGLIQANADGKSVWKCDVAIGDWKASFSMLKVPPAVIWGSGERPSVLEGEVIVTGAAQGSEVPSDKSGGKPEPVEAGIATGEETASDVAGSQGSVSPTAASLEDEMIDLIAGDGAAASMSQPEATTPPVEPATMEEAGEGHRSRDLSPGAEDLGKQFWSWLQQSIVSHKLIINDAQAHVHTVDGKFFLVSPRIFKRYCTEIYGRDDKWKAVQDRFQKLKKHHRTDDGKNIFEVIVQGQNKKAGALKGYLLKNEKELVSNEARLLPDNPFLELKNSKGTEND